MTAREPLDDRNLIDLRPLVPPRAVKSEWPADDATRAHVIETRSAIRDLLHGRDRRRLLVIAGPCSLHDPEAAYEYAGRLGRVAEATADALVLVMRTYFEKPRTTVGWKGLVNDPHLDGSCDVPRGLELAREVLLHINGMGVPCASELLDPITPQYIADLLVWAAIGARNSESQTHREMASGVSMPVGFKNGTDGSVDVAANAMIAARHSHSFLGIDSDGATCVVRTAGNPDRHVVLRGGAGRSNYDPKTVADTVRRVAAEGIARPVLVDCSHDNSGKNPDRQPGVARDVLEQFRAGQDAILGLLLESHLNAGRQDWAPGVPLAYGVSITDACMGWDETEALLHEAAAVVRGR